MVELAESGHQQTIQTISRNETSEEGCCEEDEEALVNNRKISSLSQNSSVSLNHKSSPRNHHCRRKNSRRKWSRSSRINGNGRRSRSFSIVTMQTFLYSIWSADNRDIDEEGCDNCDEGDEEGDHGCCGLCTTTTGSREETFQNTRRRPATLRPWKFQLFGLIFCILGAGTFCSQYSEESMGVSVILCNIGGTTFSLAACFTLLSTWRHVKCILLLQLVFSVLSSLYSLTWILAFQVILATKNDRVTQVGKDMKQGFPWLLAAQYLIAGVGVVIGILSTAVASIALREINEDSSFHQTLHSSRQLTSDGENVTVAVNNSHSSYRNTLTPNDAVGQRQRTITECSASGVHETTFE